MFVYEKKLQYPVKIANPNPKYAQIIISQYGGAYIKNRYCIEYEMVQQKSSAAPLICAKL